MRLTVVGCGDAFGSGGRLQTCYLVDTPDLSFLIDCGVTSILGFNRLGRSPNTIGRIYISHLHGDHFGGLVWWLLHAQHIVKRTTALTIIGPPGIEARFVSAAEVLFPGSTQVPRRFPMVFQEFQPGCPHEDGPVTLQSTEVVHPSGAPSCALRFEVGGKSLAFSGDTEWTESLVPLGRDADLYIMECHGFERAAPYHLSWRQIEKNLPRIGARRILLTHMSEEMLAARSAVRRPDVVLAEDGLVLDV